MAQFSMSYTGPIAPMALYHFSRPKHVIMAPLKLKSSKSMPFWLGHTSHGGKGGGENACPLFRFLFRMEFLIHLFRVSRTWVCHDVSNCFPTINHMRRPSASRIKQLKQNKREPLLSRRIKESPSSELTFFLTHAGPTANEFTIPAKNSEFTNSKESLKCVKIGKKI